MNGRRPSPRRRIVFGPFALDPAGGQLWRGSEPVPLRRKSWDVLCYLTARPNVLVQNEDLLEAVWPGVSVTPQTLTNVIHEIRQALDDPAHAARFIETVPKRGHVFRGPRATPPIAEQATRARATSAVVGRDRELTRLRELWGRALAGQSQVVFLAGELGIGKTTLANAFVEATSGWQTGRVAWVTRGTCVEQHGRDEAYLPLLQAIEEILAGPHGRAALARLRRTAPTWTVQLPWRLHPDERARLEHSLLGTTPVRMLREGIALLAALAVLRPLVLVLEDLHWSDLATLDFVAALARRPVAGPLLLLATYRQADAITRAHPVVSVARDLVRRDAAVELGLAPFSRTTIAAYLEARFGDAGIGASLAGPLEEHSAGNPLFLRSLVDQLVVRGAFRRAGDGWQLAYPRKSCVCICRRVSSTS